METFKGALAEAGAARSRKKLVYVVILAAGALFYLYYGGYKILHSGFDYFGGDFKICRLAAQNWLNGISIYFKHPGIDIYLYAPPVTLLFVPFAKLPEMTARLVWLGLCHLLAGFFFWRVYRFGLGGGKLLSAAAIAGAMLFCMPFYAMLMMGNVNILIFACLPTVYGALLAGRARLVPAALAFFTVAKIFPGVLAGVFLRQKDYRALLKFFLWIAGAAAFSLLFFGARENAAFLLDLPGFTKYSGIRHSQSFTFFVKLFWPGIGLAGLLTLNLVFLAGLVAAWWRAAAAVPAEDRGPGMAAADLFALTAIMILAAPSSWIMYSAFYIVPFYFVMHSFLDDRREFRAAWLFWCAFLLICFWEIIYYQLPLSLSGLTMRQVWLERALYPRLYQGLFSILFFANLGLFSWILLNYLEFSKEAGRIRADGASQKGKL